MGKVRFASNTLGQYLLLILLIFAFVTYPGSTNSAEDPVVWYFNGLPIYFALVVTVLFLLWVIMKGAMKRIDTAGILLMTRLFICIVPLLYVSSIVSLSAHYPVVIFTLSAYLIGKSSSWRYEHQIGKIIVIFGIILCVQVIQTSQLIPVDYFNLTYKQYMRIPIAASNVIAAYIVPILILFIFNYKPSKLVKISIISLFVFALVLTKSRGGIVSLILTYVIYFVFFKYHFRLVYILPIVLALSIGVYFILDIPEVKMFMLGFSADSSSIDVNSLSSNRLELFSEEFNRFLKHPLFGNGMIFNADTSISGSHNLFIELLVQSGLVGTLTYIIPIVIVFRRSISIKTKHSIGWLMFLIATLLHGMVEVNFFNYSTDIIFWSVCGLVMSAREATGIEHNRQTQVSTIAFFPHINGIK